MSAIVSLLRVMTLRDAEGITLEAGKVPTLRRRGQVEALALPALDAALLEAFATPLLAGRSLESGPLMCSYGDDDGASYPVTIERAASGLRLVVKRASRKQAAPAAAAAPPPAPVPIATPVPPDASRLAQLLAPLVAFARERGGSDVLVSTGQAPRVRVHGALEVVDHPIDDALLAAAATAARGDSSLDVAGARVRINAFDHLGGHAIAARLIDDRVPSLAELGLPAELESIVELRDGLVLVCGPTGSGKSTTLAALIRALDERRAAHVITLEDPIEYRFAPRRCMVHQRELGTHIETFADGLRAALRENPDVILLGELRDRETLAAALTAAETGHLVLATLHAPGAAGAIDRVVDAFPEGHQRQIRVQLASSLRTIVTQYLLPRRDGGRVAAVELVPVTAAVGNIIRKGELHTLPTAIQSGREAGMIPLERSLARLLETGAVAPAAVKRIAADHDLLQSLAPRVR
ncbi:MAG TPA: PilT/PilU family type 4a pilus ATPase [Kofleriaceae bacterium]|nr:PilT/PilU family type 4a pilus ATPase [Kofleriaceae bacterium]